MVFKMIFVCVLVRGRISYTGSCTSGVGLTVAIGIACRIAILCWCAEVPLLVRKAGKSRSGMAGPRFFLLASSLLAQSGPYPRITSFSMPGSHVSE